jgi:hypothetical protein
VLQLEQFTCPGGDSDDSNTTGQACNLKDYMEQVKPLHQPKQRGTMKVPRTRMIWKKTLNGDDYYTSTEDMREQALLKLHDAFLPIARQILTDQHQYLQFGRRISPGNDK